MTEKGRSMVEKFGMLAIIVIIAKLF